jgi:hypothetical protein
MNASQHLSVLISIIVGLGLRELLLGARTALTEGWPDTDRMVRAMLIALAISIFIVLVQFWWFLFIIVSSEIWQNNFFEFLLALVRPIFLFIGAASVFPPADTEDVEKYYFRNRKLIYVPLILFEILNLSEFRRYAGMEGIGTQLFHILFITLATILAISQKIRLHFFLLCAILVLLIAFISLFSLNLV